MSTKELDCLIIFCEGAHDIAFLKLILKEVMGYKAQKLKFSEMPAPFNNLFKKAIENHSSEDLSLEMSKSFFLPDILFQKDNKIILLFSSGGQNQFEKIKLLLVDYLAGFRAISNNLVENIDIVTSVKYLFIYDSDEIAIDKRCDKLTTELGEITRKNGKKIPFISNSWGKSCSDFGRVSDDKAIFVWGDSNSKGTLEDILMPLFKQKEPDKLEKIETLMADLFTWGDDVPNQSKYKKAVLTTLGQKKKPGSSLSVIIEQSKYITNESLKECYKIQEFIKFIKTFFS